MAYRRWGRACRGRGGRAPGARPRSACAVSLHALGNLPAQRTDVRGEDRQQRAAAGTPGRTGQHASFYGEAGPESSRAPTGQQAAFCGEAGASESSRARTGERSGTREGGGPEERPRAHEHHSMAGAESPRLSQPTPALEAVLVSPRGVADPRLLRGRLRIFTGGSNPRHRLQE
jgi:hypothetical protein